jgi:hypothetical protein
VHETLVYLVAFPFHWLRHRRLVRARLAIVAIVDGEDIILLGMVPHEEVDQDPGTREQGVKRRIADLGSLAGHVDPDPCGERVYFALQVVGSLSQLRVAVSD